MNQNLAYSATQSEAYINTTAVFGAIERTIVTDDFKGGSIRNLFGSTDLDFSNADLTGTAVLDIAQAFGEISLTVPHDWRVEFDFSQVFTGIDDLRERKTQPAKIDKLLVLKGRCLFAAVEILTSL
jgi:predicted membrane protein